MPLIVYTLTDEAPALATAALLPVLRAFTRHAGTHFELEDISLAGRILARFPERLTADQRQEDALAKLGAMAKQADATIVKLPNISASIPQLREAIAELQAAGFDVPDHHDDPQNDEQRATNATYAKVLGSAVNPVLREGNSDRRVAGPVKAYARAHPHAMGAWSQDSKSHVSHMAGDDFYGSEQSVTLAEPTTVRIQLVGESGETRVLREGLTLEAGEVLDSATMSVAALRSFFREQIADAKQQGVLFSLHMKATMMKVSDPIIFGHAVEVFYGPVLEKHADALAAAGFEPDNGIGDLHARLDKLPDSTRSQIQAQLEELYAERPPLAMVDSDRGITNLHVPSDVIIDASMPAMIRNGGRMWGPDGEAADTKAVIPDRSYAGVYEETIQHCREHGAFDPATMGSVANVGLMAKKAQEYGSHDKTFEVPAAGRVQVVDEGGTVLMEHAVEAGDLFRACQTKDVAVKDWVRLAVERARESGAPAVFWLDENRAHDAELLKKVHAYLEDHDTSGLDVSVLAPAAATRHALERCRAGEDTISVTGNVLRDYLTDLFPILELGTSAKMLSIVPLLAGGGLYETGAGGSAPKHVQQFEKESHLRWDSLGEYLAVAVALGDSARKKGNTKRGVVARALDAATGKLLAEDRSPLRKAGQLDNRGSTAWLARYWAEALATQTEDAELAAVFGPVSDELGARMETILAEIDATEGQAADLGGYHRPDRAKVDAAMRPSATFNAIIDAI
ncbi:NADP-dependent isocitrate dehydrogenase [Phycisphaera mikurensis]|uniref:Isocitrate dehydrogenase [NADP] n=1 Tax=Phycisphaera mikurensis (strain NBRC 102666 / KCTC 22515 / FYK2301M01) TaxID=1142394 RepID=I0IE50_PHYMF|nr:NADP-dependent isocitrate dehydrogenase [Phycisphaera mikurensis]MBB6441343.1 isocitrate dehydrogenase [Phycisphaera mikurensis]BAM03538.1 isocitrate dehydrogenase [Phycisphaera mikurensis NBRC 102666]